MFKVGHFEILVIRIDFSPYTVLMCDGWCTMLRCTWVILLIILLSEILKTLQEKRKGFLAQILQFV